MFDSWLIQLYLFVVSNNDMNTIFMLILLWGGGAVKFWAVLHLFHIVRTPNMLAVLCTSTRCQHWRTGLSLAWKHCVNLHLTISYSVVILSFGEWAIWDRCEAIINGLISEHWSFLKQWYRTGPSQKSMIFRYGEHWEVNAYYCHCKDRLLNTCN